MRPLTRGVSTGLVAAFSFVVWGEKQDAPTRNQSASRTQWIYNDLAKAISQARKQSKPIIALIR